MDNKIWWIINKKTILSILMSIEIREIRLEWRDRLRVFLARQWLKGVVCHDTRVQIGLARKRDVSFNCDEVELMRGKNLLGSDSEEYYRSWN